MWLFLIFMDIDQFYHNFVFTNTKLEDKVHLKDTGGLLKEKSFGHRTLVWDREFGYYFIREISFSTEPSMILYIWTKSSTL